MRAAQQLARRLALQQVRCSDHCSCQASRAPANKNRSLPFSGNKTLVRSTAPPRQHPRRNHDHTTTTQAAAQSSAATSQASTSSSAGGLLIRHSQARSLGGGTTTTTAAAAADARAAFAARPLAGGRALAASPSTSSITPLATAASSCHRQPQQPQQQQWQQQQHRLLHAPSAAALYAAARSDVVVPPMGDSISEGTVAAVLKKAGEAVSVDEVVAQIETDKVTIDVKSPVGGAVTDVLVKEQDTVVVGQAVVRVEEGAAGTESAAAAAPAAAAAAEPAPAAAAAAAAAPAAAAAAPPPAAARKAPSAPPPPPAAAAAAASTAGTAVGGSAKRPERRVKMTRLRQRVAERLKGAQNTYAMLTTFNEVDMTGLSEMRAAHKDAFLEKYGVKLGFMSAFVKAAALALSEVPAVNAVIDGDEIVYRDYVDVSIAVATPKGLVVPVLRDADQLDFAGVERAIAGLGRKARDSTLSVDDMAGGTFTISNGGVYGSMLSTPIINPPQSAILGMHNVVQRAVVLPGGRIEPRPVMYAALTYDHRLIDGREAVTFLKRVKETVEDPRRLLLGV
jgi:2-oxoglutarate dehydrogenase E2 component (dihydrolipoamide succinyltransferase)